MARVAEGRAAAGRAFSLVEVVVASGILAGVLLAVGTMFVLGERQLKSGWNISAATAIAQDIMETTQSRSFSALYTTLGARETEARKTVSSAESGSPIERWQPEIAGRLDGGTARVTLEALGDGHPTFREAAGIRLTVDVCWREMGTTRCVSLATARF